MQRIEVTSLLSPVEVRHMVHYLRSPVEDHGFTPLRQGQAGFCLRIGSVIFDWLEANVSAWTLRVESKPSTFKPSPYWLYTFYISFEYDVDAAAFLFKGFA